MSENHLPPIIGMTHAEIVDLCRLAGAKPVHAERIVASIFRRYNSDIDAIPDLPVVLRHYLAGHTSIFEPGCSALQQAEDGTRKLLLKMPDGKEVETVLIQGPGRLTQCISTQVGCAVGCSFCLTATAGLTRNLTTAEMVAQVMAGQRVGERRVRNLVLMGMGEPLHNYDAVARFVHIASDPKGMAFSPNRITLSTSGMVPGIYRMIEEKLPCNLAVSLNATTDAVRDRVIPINRKYPIKALMQAVRDYISARGNKRVLMEYVLLAGVNDSIEDAGRLIELLVGMECTVNLLPFNVYPGSAFESPSDAAVSAFRSALVEAGIIAVVRESRGRDISAACGQLKTEVAKRRGAVA
ncbi:23S rRNA m(2)A-2503 methyltransferase [Mariprofundus ferrinatatus]|uniref:Dual-specificity RNA methyltransferase RlmN n=1 Tax=Mariprofundus ferrinatatus TaxID=1921087 RepID=A0A2K8L6U7_9PROT|nr:23S rRNA (adenine(2503)-C(2))-methyltransferase RlmN [Mariprofundus ferrinatatus]ATX82842.1 23S rRNA m(2)A-2503 methyltransferase [Mariprofundus ferrinatatus]